MKFRGLAAVVTPALLVLALAPVTAQAADEDRDPRPKSASVTDIITDPTPVLPEETSPKWIRKRETDTLSLYEQAGLTPPRRIQRALADTTSDAGGAVAANAIGTDSAGNALPPGIKSHVDQSCTGTTDGARVQVMYLRETDAPDRYAQVLPILRNEARYIDDVFAVSSMQTGGGKRVRWVYDSGCTISVLNVVLPDGALTGGHALTEKALADAGYLTSQRKYLAFADVPMGGLGGSACGQGSLYVDTKPTDNANDGRYPQMSRTDLECWVTGSQGRSAPLHELLHTMGAVQSETPHGGGGFHCSDGSEVMCYDDGYSTVTQVCPAEQVWDLDCNNDDYFNTNPAPGSYLATHWNIANSPFLDTVPSLPAPPSISMSPSTTTPEVGDLVTFTASVAPGTVVNWSTDAPHCENTGAPKTGTTYSIQCFDQFQPTVTATASNGGVTVSHASSQITYGPGQYPTLVVSAPDSALVGNAFPITADVENAKSPWTYQWAARTAGCKINSGASSTAAEATCDSSVAGQFGSFSVTATRTADGTTLVDTVAVRILDAGTPAVQIQGPAQVRPGELATFTATVSNVSNPTYQWHTQRGWGESTQPSVTVAVPLTGGGEDTVFLTVSTPTGEQVTATHTYVVTTAFAMTMDGPSSLVAGTTGTFTVTPSAPAAITWSDDRSACEIVPSAAPTVARLTCDEAFDGTVTVTSTGTAGAESVTRTKTVSVSPQASELQGTALTFTASTGYPTRLLINLRDSVTGEGVPDRTVRVERAGSAGSFTLVQEVALNSHGNASVDLAVRQAGSYRVRFTGDSEWASATSRERWISLATRLSNVRTASGLKATLATGWGSRITNTAITLQKRVVGASRWVKVKAYTTNSSGVVKVRIDPKQKTDYRWKFSGNATYRSSSSTAVRLR